MVLEIIILLVDLSTELFVELLITLLVAIGETDLLADRDSAVVVDATLASPRFACERVASSPVVFWATLGERSARSATKVFRVNGPKG